MASSLCSRTHPVKQMKRWRRRRRRRQRGWRRRRRCGNSTIRNNITKIGNKFRSCVFFAVVSVCQFQKWSEWVRLAKKQVVRIVDDKAMKQPKKKKIEKNLFFLLSSHSGFAFFDSIWINIIDNERNGTVYGIIENSNGRACSCCLVEKSLEKYGAKKIRLLYWTNY